MAATSSTTNGHSDELAQMKDVLASNLLQISAFSGEILDAIGRANHDIQSGFIRIEGKINKVAGEVNTVVQQTSVIRSQSMVVNEIQGAVAGIANSIQQVEEDNAAGLHGASVDLQQIKRSLSQLNSSISTIHRRLDHVEEVLIGIQVHTGNV